MNGSVPEGFTGRNKVVLTFYIYSKLLVKMKSSLFFNEAPVRSTGDNNSLSFNLSTIIFGT